MRNHKNWRKFKQRLSTIPSISTKLATTSHLNSISQKDHRYTDGNSAHGLKKSQKYGRVKPVNRITTPLVVFVYTAIQNKYLRPAQIHSKTLHRNKKMIDNINMDSTLAGSVNTG